MAPMEFEASSPPKMGSSVESSGHDGGSENGVAPPQAMNPLWKTRLCSFFSTSGCRHGSLCTFAHGPQELRRAPDFTRTSICPELLRSGSCDQPNCPYAHNRQELRSAPGLMKTRMCDFYRRGTCIAHEACRFAHQVSELKGAATAFVESSGIQAAALDGEPGLAVEEDPDTSAAAARPNPGSGPVPILSLATALSPPPPPFEPPPPPPIQAEKPRRVAVGQEPQKQALPTQSKSTRTGSLTKPSPPASSSSEVSRPPGHIRQEFQQSSLPPGFPDVPGARQQQDGTFYRSISTGGSTATSSGSSFPTPSQQPAVAAPVQGVGEFRVGRDRSESESSAVSHADKEVVAWLVLQELQNKSRGLGEGAAVLPKDPASTPDSDAVGFPSLLSSRRVPPTVVSQEEEFPVAMAVAEAALKTDVDSQAETDYQNALDEEDKIALLQRWNGLSPEDRARILAHSQGIGGPAAKLDRLEAPGKKKPGRRRRKRRTDSEQTPPGADLATWPSRRQNDEQRQEEPGLGESSADSTTPTRNESAEQLGDAAATSFTEIARLWLELEAKGLLGCREAVLQEVFNARVDALHQAQAHVDHLASRLRALNSASRST